MGARPQRPFSSIVKSAKNFLNRLWLLPMLAALVLARCGASEPSGPSTDVTPQIDGDVVAGTPVTITISGPVGQPGEFNLPSVDGLTVNGSGSNPNTTPPELTFFVTPAHAGTYTIPAFYIHSDDGKNYHVLPLTLHVTNG
jgi:hypothetical protein